MPTLIVGASLGFIGLAKQAEAAVTITIVEIGGNIVFTSSGTLELPDSNPVIRTDFIDNFVNLGFAGYYGVQPSGSSGSPFAEFVVPVSASGNLVSTTFLFGTLNLSGDLFINFGTTTGSRVVVPEGFVSGSSFNKSSTLVGGTFALLGITSNQSTTLSFAVPGGTETVTFQTGISVVPEPASAISTILLLGGGLLLRRPPVRGRRAVS